jgi:uncharacterized oxidoreductase
MAIDAPRLHRVVDSIFAAAGCRAEESARVARYLVEANLVGHDSHGVIRVPSYIDWLRAGKVLANQTLEVVTETDVLAVVDGRFGFGQTMGEAAMDLGVAKCRRSGLAAVALRNSGHLGRIGDWAERAVAAGLISLHFVNTSGGGILVAPTGGTRRRLSANPIAAGVPREDAAPIIVDVSTCLIAEGKIRVALNRGLRVPAGCLLDGHGLPTDEPRAFYAEPPGAILPMAGHKGYALSFLVEVLAGALTGGSCSDPAVKRVANNMLTILVDPNAFRAHEEFRREIERFIAHVKACPTAEPDGEILAPGEPEARARARRLAEGIDLDDTTREQIRATAGSLGLTDEELAGL